MAAVAFATVWGTLYISLRAIACGGRPDCGLTPFVYGIYSIVPAALGAVGFIGWLQRSTNWRAIAWIFAGASILLGLLAAVAV